MVFFCHTRQIWLPTQTSSSPPPKKRTLLYSVNYLSTKKSIASLWCNFPLPDIQTPLLLHISQFNLHLLKENRFPSAFLLSQLARFIFRARSLFSQSWVRVRSALVLWHFIAAFLPPLHQHSVLYYIEIVVLIIMQRRKRK